MRSRRIFPVSKRVLDIALATEWQYVQSGGNVVNKLVTNLAALVKVKTFVTLLVVSVFVVLALRGDITADNVMIILSAVISFYFGTQHEKK